MGGRVGGGQVDIVPAMGQLDGDGRSDRGLAHAALAHGRQRRVATPPPDLVDEFDQRRRLISSIPTDTTSASALATSSRSIVRIASKADQIAAFERDQSGDGNIPGIAVKPLVCVRPSRRQPHHLTWQPQDPVHHQPLVLEPQDASSWLVRSIELDSLSSRTNVVCSFVAECGDGLPKCRTFCVKLTDLGGMPCLFVSGSPTTPPEDVLFETFLQISFFLPGLLVGMKLSGTPSNP